ncbi:MAG: carboxylating nicotinate-nucleotide diphosphorylase [Syntrophobacteraceae bacterium]
MNRTDTLLWLALDEDVGQRDITTEALVGPDSMGQAVVLGREPFVLSGSYPFRRVFELIEPGVRVECFYKDGETIAPDVPAFKIDGRARTLLTGERTALNLLQRLCGIATYTRKMVEAISGTRCILLDTRKTTPLWRALEKEAVRHGGGSNHRFGLSDGILIKDNHIAAVGGVRTAIGRARRVAPHTMKMEAEVENLEELEDAIGAGADIVLLDNFPIDLMRQAVVRTAGRCLLEASGGVTLDSVREIAETGVDFVSCGALTHSVRSIDISMEFSCGEVG